MVIASRESQAWLRLAAQTDCPVPDTLADLARELTVRKERAKQHGPAPVRPKNGKPSEVAAAEAALHAFHVAGADLAHEQELAAIALNGGMESMRVDLITDVLRPWMAELVERGRADVEAGHHDREAVLRDGDAKALRAHQRVTELEAAFGHGMAAWRESWTALRRTHAHLVDTREVNVGYQFFRHPERVRDDRLAGRAVNRMGRELQPDPSVAKLALEDPDVGFRLALVTDLADVYARVQRVALETRQPTHRVVLL